jgi:hypothetical protein
MQVANSKLVVSCNTFIASISAAKNNTSTLR